MASEETEDLAGRDCGVRGERAGRLTFRLVVHRGFSRSHDAPGLAPMRRWPPRDG